MSPKVAVVALMLVIYLPKVDLDAQSSNEISQLDRALIATRIYYNVHTFFPDLVGEQFDRNYGDYLGKILTSANDRKAFDLASMELVATLHDGHSFFYDNWLDQAYGQEIGITVYADSGRWVVMRSRLGTVKIGDVIEAIDGTPTQAYFEQRREYISGSSERDVATSFFDTPVLFPQRFTLTLDGGRQVVVDRQQDVKRPQANTTQGRWLVAGSVGYIKVPTFRTIEAQSTALEYLREFRGARAVILDLRGNMGGDGGVALQRALFDKPYPLWTVTSAVAGGFLLREYDVAYPQGAHLSTSDAKVLPRGTVFSGRLLLLVDRGCSCACEDFVMPFKVTGRATLVGETTAGTFSFTNFTQFENGMMLNLASIRHTFPDGSRFEGIGIAPDVEVHASVSDLKAGNDPALDRALQLAGQPPAATH